MTRGIALDTNAVRLWELANRGEWDVGDEVRGDESLAMLRIFLYGDQANWIPPSVVAELGDHGSAAVRAATDAALAVTFLELEIQDQQAIDEFVGRWTGRGASRADAIWLGQAWHVGYVATAITFDLRLVRGVGGEVDGMMVRTPSEYWAEMDLEPGSEPRVVPAFRHPLYGNDTWRI